ncbi:MAG: hypothetical protein ACYSW8_33395 [Planctomycetota bacterium]|jgi:hypothetical protein
MAVYRNSNVVFVTAAQTILKVWGAGGRLARVVFTSADAAGGSIKIFDTDGAATASKQVFEATIDKIGSEDTATRTHECGIKFETGCSIVVVGVTVKVVLVFESREG